MNSNDFTTNLKLLIKINGLEATLQAIDSMLTETKTIQELNAGMEDEIYYTVQNLETTK